MAESPTFLSFCPPSTPFEADCIIALNISYVLTARLNGRDARRRFGDCFDSTGAPATSLRDLVDGFARRGAQRTDHELTSKKVNLLGSREVTTTPLEAEADETQEPEDVSERECTRMKV